MLSRNSYNGTIVDDKNIKSPDFNIEVFLISWVLHNKNMGCVNGINST